MMPRFAVVQMNITKGESTHPFAVPAALEEPVAAIFRVLRRPRNPSTVAGSPAALGRGRLPHVCCSKQANKARGGKRSAGGSAGQEPGGREASAGQDVRRTARRTRRYGGEVHGACGALQAERSRWIADRCPIGIWMADMHRYSCRLSADR
jgi:hypothetical protein